MNVRSIEYVIQIADAGNIAAAAERLFLTPSALDQQLLKLEKELGTKLFVRSKKALVPTQAGEVYLKYGRKIVQLKTEAYQIINDYAEIAQGRFSVGLTPERGMEMFVAVYPRFYIRYPSVTIQPQEIGSSRQLDLLEEEKLDVGFVAMNRPPERNLLFDPIHTEQLLLVVPNLHPWSEMGRKEQDQTGEPPFANLRQFKEEPFALMTPDSTQRLIIDEYFKEAGFVPHIVLETASNHTLLAMVKNCMCCAIVPSHYVHPDEDYICFSLEGMPKWTTFVCHKKGRYIGKAVRTFIEMAREFWAPAPD